MTRDGLQRALIDLGWISLIHRVLGGRPAESYALHTLMRRAGAPVSYDDLEAEYEAHEVTGGSIRPSKGVRNGSVNAIRKRIERLRAGLADIGVENIIRTVGCQSAYIIEKRDIPRLQEALLFACGIELSDAA